MTNTEVTKDNVKVGDKVRVKTNIKSLVDPYRIDVVEDMLEFQWKIVEVKEVNLNSVEATEDYWEWAYNWLERVEQKPVVTSYTFRGEPDTLRLQKEALEDGTFEFIMVQPSEYFVRQYYFATEGWEYRVISKSDIPECLKGMKDLKDNRERPSDEVIAKALKSIKRAMHETTKIIHC